MSEFTKNARLVTLVKRTNEELDETANEILSFLDDQPLVAGVAVNQTYRTYESKASKGAKSFINTPYFTNALIIKFTRTDHSKIEEILNKVKDIATKDED